MTRTQRNANWTGMRFQRTKRNSRPSSRREVSVAVTDDHSSRREDGRLTAANSSDRTSHGTKGRCTPRTSVSPRLPSRAPRANNGPTRPLRTIRTLLFPRLKDPTTANLIRPPLVLGSFPSPNPKLTRGFSSLARSLRRWCVTYRTRLLFL